MNYTDRMNKARNDIHRAMVQQGPVTHNLIGLLLLGVAQDLDNGAANALIEEFQLDILYGIFPVND